MAAPPLLQLTDLACNKQKGQPIFSGVNLTVNEGDILILQGKSGSGSVHTVCEHFKESNVPRTGNRHC